MAPPATCKAIKEPIKDEWATATRTHAFLQDVNRGTISDARFNTWLAQVRFDGRLCPVTRMGVMKMSMAWKLL
jgi:hypothetical protein